MTPISPLLAGLLLALYASEAAASALASASASASATNPHPHAITPTGSSSSSVRGLSSPGLTVVRWLFLSARNRLATNAAPSLVDRGRRGLKKNAGDGDDCWGWQDDWTDDYYEPCWDGTYEYELDPNDPPERCKNYEPGKDTDDWTDVCETWYLMHGCSKDGQPAEECGSSDDGAKEMCCNGHRCASDGSGNCELIPPTMAPTERCAVGGEEAKVCGGKGKNADADSCCPDHRCGEDGTCHAQILPTCADVGGRATACGGAGAGAGAGGATTLEDENLFVLPSTCCDGLVCSETGDQCVAMPPPPTECIDSASQIVYQTPSGFPGSANECNDLLASGETTSVLEEECSRMMFGDVYQVQDYCPVTCGVCTTPPPTTLAPVSSSPTATPTAGPTLSPVVLDHSLIPFSTFSMEVTFHTTESPGRYRALLTYDENELEQRTAEHLSNTLQRQFQAFISVNLDMTPAANEEEEYTKASHTFTGVARFHATDFAKLPSPSEIDSAILESFDDDAFLNSLQASTDPGLASATAVSVAQVIDDVLPTPGTRPPDSETPKDRALPVGAIAGIFFAACVFCAALAIGIYRCRNQLSKRSYSRKPSSPLGTQASSLAAGPSSEGKFRKYYEEMSCSDGASNFSGLDDDGVSIGYTDQGEQEGNPLGPIHDSISLGDDSYSYGGPESNPRDQASSGSIGDGNSTSVGDDQSLANMSALGEVRLGKVLSVLSVEDGYGTDISLGGDSAFNEVWTEGRDGSSEDQGILQLDYGSAVAGSVLYQEGEKPHALEVFKDDSLEKYEEDDSIAGMTGTDQSSDLKSTEEAHRDATTQLTQ